MKARQAQAADWEALRRLGLRALADAPDVGLVRVFAEPDAPGRMHLVSMWVDPGYRRRGVAVRWSLRPCAGRPNAEPARSARGWLITTPPLAGCTSSSVSNPPR